MDTARHCKNRHAAEHIREIVDRRGRRVLICSECRRLAQAASRKAYRQPITPAIERLLSRRVIDVERGGCWISDFSDNGSGYGYSKISEGGRGGRSLFVHRVSYEHFVGPIPDDLQIDHLCKNPRCFNPEHLEAVTPRENLLRSSCISAVHARRTHCASGHPFSGSNLIIRGDGTRQCRSCKKQRERDGRARRRAAEVTVATT